MISKCIYTIRLNTMIIFHSCSNFRPLAFIRKTKIFVCFPDEGQGPKIQTRVKNYHSVYLLFPPEFSFENIYKT